MTNQLINVKNFNTSHCRGILNGIIKTVAVISSPANHKYFNLSHTAGRSKTERKWPFLKICRGLPTGPSVDGLSPWGFAAFS